MNGGFGESEKYGDREREDGGGEDEEKGKGAMGGRHTGVVGRIADREGPGARRGNHASTSITRDSLTIGFPLAVTEIYRRPSLTLHLTPSASGPGIKQIPRFHSDRKREIDAREPR